MKYLSAFALFWWDFIVGDDPLIALGIVATLAACFALSRVGIPGWWLAPIAVLGLLSWSVLRATPRA